LGRNVKVDYTNGENGHLRIDNQDGFLLIKALPASRAFPVTPQEISNMANFRYVLLCSRDEAGKIELYQISVGDILSICKNRKIRDSNDVQWITFEEYIKFKRDYFIS
jgi:hypothetical protein